MINLKTKKMKNLLILTILLIGYSGFSQDEVVKSESELICKTVDEFSDDVSVSTIESVVLYEDGGDMRSEGLIAILFLKEDKKGKVLPSTLYMKVLGIKGCIDTGSTLDVIFENGEKTQLSNWKKFDCEGKNYFDLKGKEDLFKSSKIKAIKYTNKRNYDSMIVKTNMDEKGSSYVMNTLLELDKINNGEVNVGTCKE